MSTPHTIPIPSQPRRRFRRGPFWIVTATLALFLFGASAPSPLYVVYQQRFGFSATTLTAIFAVYALALLITLIPAGALSDQVGRRPVILAAVTLQVAAMVPSCSQTERPRCSRLESCRGSPRAPQPGRSAPP